MLNCMQCCLCNSDLTIYLFSLLKYLEEAELWLRECQFASKPRTCSFGSATLLNYVMVPVQGHLKERKWKWQWLSLKKSSVLKFADANIKIACYFIFCYLWHFSLIIVVSKHVSLCITLHVLGRGFDTSGRV